MGIRGRTCLVALLLIALCLPGAASPGAGQGACVVRLSLSAETAFDEPLDRWLNQLCDLVALQVNVLRWDEGAQAQVVLTMGAHQAFALRLARTQEQTLFNATLTGDTVKLSAQCDWADALIDAAVQAIDLPEGGRLIPISGEGLGRSLSAAAVNMRAWAAVARAQACQPCGNCGVCEMCRLCRFTEAMADMADALGHRFDETAFDQNVLLIDIDPVEPVPMPAAPRGTVPPAPDELTVRLVQDATFNIANAIAANEPSQE